MTHDIDYGCLPGPNSSPKANIRPRHVTVTEGEDAILRCDVSGEEPIDIRWQKRGGELSRTAMVRRNYLEIKKTTVRDRGHYRCTVKNKYGQASALGSLFVNEGKGVTTSLGALLNRGDMVGKIAAFVSQVEVGMSAHWFLECSSCKD